MVCRNRENQHLSEEELDVLREILRRKKKRDLKAVEEVRRESKDGKTFENLVKDAN
ncbi:MAG: hypothetical protein JWQ40_3503 [Segetibacter sp.]|nr:hypothetical protein [Segetibacter sp.]